MMSSKTGNLPSWCIFRRSVLLYGHGTIPFSKGVPNGANQKISPQPWGYGKIAAVTEASAALFFLYQPQGVSPFFVFRKDLRKLSRVWKTRSLKYFLVNRFYAYFGVLTFDNLPQKPVARGFHVRVLGAAAEACAVCTGERPRMRAVPCLQKSSSTLTLPGILWSGEMETSITSLSVLDKYGQRMKSEIYIYIYMYIHIYIHCK